MVQNHVHSPNSSHSNNILSLYVFYRGVGPATIHYNFCLSLAMYLNVTHYVFACHFRETTVFAHLMYYENRHRWDGCRGYIQLR